MIEIPRTRRKTMCAMPDKEYKDMIHTLVVPENLLDEEKRKRDTGC